MAVLWLMLLLMPASCLLQTTQDPNSPIKNVRMDPEHKRLTWDLNGNVDQISCIEESRLPVQAKNNRYCSFELMSPCKVTNYTVTVTDPPFSTWILFPEPDGTPGAAAENLSCRVHDVDFLTCDWTVGRAAPQDVQYQLYVEDGTTLERRKCLHYKTDDRGTHVGCRFDDISRLSKYPHGLRFTVGGTSGAARVPCTDVFRYLSAIEKLTPPNITVTCNKTHSFMEWKMLSYFNHRFNYELQIQKSTEAAATETLQVKEHTSFTLLNTGAYTVRIRVREVFDELLSEWSAPQRFECDQEEDMHTRSLRTSLLAALGVLLALLLALLLCRRYRLSASSVPAARRSAPWVPQAAPAEPPRSTRACRALGSAIATPAAEVRVSGPSGLAAALQTPGDAGFGAPERPLPLGSR
ncbi:PREDICTED: interleukin-3 receptor subunit alpha isoform X2 [Propithecus coquereli]|uniref:interleukin-3 receptor subunit alpha isoform X2 n=1 Tax=Propithecus coquereli TaxID=379532 RepID=UPI00063F4B98|nr:PREDICTED: interleukin-3 receptor subunit alpha isoform X2 [Propithecus coquereli]